MHILYDTKLLKSTTCSKSDLNNYKTGRVYNWYFHQIQ